MGRGMRDAVTLVLGWKIHAVEAVNRPFFTIKLHI